MNLLNFDLFLGIVHLHNFVLLRQLVLFRLNFLPLLTYLDFLIEKLVVLVEELVKFGLILIDGLLKRLVVSVELNFGRQVLGLPAHF